MNRQRERGSHDGSKRSGLSVRYCFDGQEENQDNGEKSGDESEGISEIPQSLSANRTRKAPNHLHRSNNWFQADFKRKFNLNTDRITRRNGTDFASGDEGGRCDWRGEDDIDPGIFITEKVEQHATEDLITWDSSSCTSACCSQFDILENASGGNNRAHRLSLGGGGSSTYSAPFARTSWGTTRCPVPPSAARNITSNKADDSGNDSGGAASKKNIENTYRLEPKPGQSFLWFRVKKPMISVVDQLLDEFVYNVKSGPAVTKKICEVLLKTVKKTFDFPRYKYVCHVTLVPLKQQGVMIADRALWNTSVDNVVSYTYKTKALVCVVTFHALYFE